MSKLDQLLGMDGATIIYDGDCPFCTRYVALTELRRTVGDVRLVDARTDLPLSDELKDRGLDLNDGMVVLHEGRTHFGGDATHVLALLSEKRSFVAKFLGALFKNRGVSRAIYPLLRFGRNITLRALGKSKI